MTAEVTQLKITRQPEVRIPGKRWLLLVLVGLLLARVGLWPGLLLSVGAGGWFLWRQTWRRMLPYRARRELTELRAGDGRREMRHPPKLRWAWRRRGVWHIVWKVPSGVTPASVTMRKEALDFALGIDSSWRSGRWPRHLHLWAGPRRLPKEVRYADYVGRVLPAGVLPAWAGRSTRGALAIDLRRSTSIAGTSGEGKSSTQRALLMQAAERYSPEQVRLALIDPGGELAIFKRLPHVFCSGFDGEASEAALAQVVLEMKRRLALLSQADFEDIERWNRERPNECWPYLLVAVDELAQLTLDKARKQGVEDLRQVCAMGRKAGVVALLALQRTDAEALPGNIKVNILQTIAHRVPNEVSSRVLIEAPDAAELPEGDPGLAILSWGGLQRFRALWLSKQEAVQRVEAICQGHRPTLRVVQPVEENASDA